MVLLTLSVLSVLALISLRRRAHNISREQRHGAEPSGKSPSRAEKTLAHLIAGLDSVSGITFSAVVTTTGKVLASSASTDAVSAQATAELLDMYNCSKRMANDLGREHLEQVTVNGKDGFLLVESMGNDVLLFVTIDPDAKFGRVAEKVTLAAQKIQELLTHPRY